MAHALKTEVGISAVTLRIIADARLRDFDALWKAGQFHSAVYMAGYSVEEYLKCAICKTLSSPQLPCIFEYHILESLLFYSGLQQQMESDTRVFNNFAKIKKLWKVEMRYDDPTNSVIDHAICVDVNRWLNDPIEGIVPWFRSKL